MKQQNLSNHSRYVPGFHIVLLGLLVAGFAASFINLRNLTEAENLAAKLLCLVFVCMILTAYYARAFALKAQDRAIRAEEKLRYFTLTGKLPAHNLTLSQYTALRFAPDEEFVQLADKAATECLAPKQIKRQISNWKGDFERV